MCMFCIVLGIDVEMMAGKSTPHLLKSRAGLRDGGFEGAIPVRLAAALASFCFGFVPGTLPRFPPQNLIMKLVVMPPLHGRQTHAG